MSAESGLHVGDFPPPSENCWTSPATPLWVQPTVGQVVDGRVTRLLDILNDKHPTLILSSDGNGIWFTEDNEESAVDQAVDYFENGDDLEFIDVIEVVVRRRVRVRRGVVIEEGTP